MQQNRPYLIYLREVTWYFDRRSFEAKHKFLIWGQLEQQGGYLKFWVTLTVCLLSRFIADWSHTFCIYNYVTAHTYCFECGTNFIDWQLQTYISGDLIIELVKGTGKVTILRFIPKTTLNHLFCLFSFNLWNA